MYNRHIENREEVNDQCIRLAGEFGKLEAEQKGKTNDPLSSEQHYGELRNMPDVESDLGCDEHEHFQEAMLPNRKHRRRVITPLRGHKVDLSGKSTFPKCRNRVSRTALGRDRLFRAISEFRIDFKMPNGANVYTKIARLC